MADKKTRVIVEAEARGFQKAKNEAKGLSKELDPTQSVKGFKQLNHFIGEMQRQVRGLTSGLKEANRALRMDGGAQATKAMKAEVEKLRKEVEKLTQAKARDADMDDRRANRRGFAMGVMQGAGVGEYFPQQGMGANFAGRMVGSGARRAGHVGSAFAASPFTGLQGVTQGLSGIPVVGGFLAGQMQSAMSAAGGALSMRRQMMGMGMFQGSTADLAGAYQSGAGGAKLVGAGTTRRWARDATNRRMMEELPAYTDGAIDVRGGGDPARRKAEELTRNAQIGREYANIDPYNFGTLAPARAPGQARQGHRDYVGRERAKAREDRQDQIEGQERRKAERRAAAINEDRRKAAGNAAVSKAIRSPFTSMIAAGEDYGAMTAPQSLQFQQQMLQTAGGGLGQFSGRDYEVAVAAQTRYGIGADVSGAFGRGRSTGAAMSGGFEQALSTGLSLGLSGSDLTKYMRMMAQQLMAWDQTGIPTDLAAQGDASRMLGGAVGGIQGQRLAAGFAQAGRGIAKGGVGNASQFMMLRDLYGYSGGGTEDFIDAMRAAETGSMSAKGLEKFVGRFQKQGRSSKVQAFMLQQALGQAGMQVGQGGARKLLGMTSGAAMKQVLGDVRTDAKDILDPALAGKAKDENRRLGVGEKLLPSMLSLEEATTTTLENFGKFSTEINAVTEMIATVSKDASGWVTRIREILTAVEESVGLTPGG